MLKSLVCCGNTSAMQNISIDRSSPMSIEVSAPRISIVMPAYNSEKYIRNSIESVLAQTHTDWELIIADNGSDDTTQDIVRSFSEIDPRIRSLKADQHRSAAYARRFAIDNARGEWIAFLDSDDLWTADKLSIQLAEAERQNCGFVFSGSAFIDSEGDEKDYVLHVPGKVSYAEILKQNIISCSSVLIRRELLDGCFTETDNDICEDYAAWIRVLRDRNVTAVGIDRPLLIYRMGSSSLSSNKIKSAVRTYKTLRRTGVKLPLALRSWISYVYRNLKKYTSIK